MNCPRCGSSNTAKCGKNPRNIQRYWCAGCDKGFQAEYPLSKGPNFTSGSRDRWYNHWEGDDRRYDDDD